MAPKDPQDDERQDDPRPGEGHGADGQRGARPHVALGNGQALQAPGVGQRPQAARHALRLVARMPHLRCQHSISLKNNFWEALSQ